MENPSQSETWYAEGLAFECTQCGRCCSGPSGFVWIDGQETQKLAEFMNLDLDTFERKFTRLVGAERSLVEYPDGDCIFLDPDSRRCSVYEARPIQCRTWPFWNANLSRPEAWKRAGESCPGCDRGQLYSFQEIEDRRNQKDV